MVKRFVYLTSLAIAVGISSPSEAEPHNEGGYDGYVNCWITRMEPGTGPKVKLGCYKTLNEQDQKQRKNNDA